ncbi:hypothetical protein Scep_025250 [Stephania cephalantha]|uniref:Uncharacterized protein n=1 Tax=Stephania cephalantha TaxID=152367 RepID=A0AAP0HRD7_9MAGN
MKIVSSLVASIVAASAVALNCSAERGVSAHSCANQESSCCRKDGVNGPMKAMVEEKFTPRFDGLRFIETLVTAHR